MQQKVFWRGWVVQFVAMLSFMFMAFFNISGFSYMNTYFKGLGWDVSLLLSANSIAGWVSLVVNFGLMHLIAKKACAKTVMSLGFLIQGVNYILLGFAKAVPAVAVAIIVNQVASGFYCITSSTTLIGKWYPRKKGVILGWVTSTTMFATLVLLPWFRNLVIASGFAKACLIFGALPILCAVITFALVKESPTECGWLPDNKPMTEEEKIKFTAAKGLKSPWTLKKFVTNKNLMCATIGWGLALMCQVGVGGITLLNLVSKGLEQGAAVKVMSYAGIMLFIGSYLSGVIDQKLGPVKSSVCVIGLVTVGFLMMGLVPAGNIVLIIIAYVLINISNGAPNNLCVSQMMTLVPQRYYMSVNKTYTTLYSILRSAGSVLVAWILKMTANNYSRVYLVFGIVYIVSLVFIVLAGSKELPIPEEADASVAKN